MKGGIQGLKVSQASVILVGLVCVTALMVACTKSSFLASLIPNQSQVLQLYLGSRQTSKRNNSTLKEGAQQIESLGSSGIELAPVIGKTENATITNKRVFPPALGSKESEQLSGGKNRSKQAETVSVVGSSTKGDQTRNFSATTGKKDCNYAKGKWVFDDNWPLYSGNGCTQWLSPMWACRQTQRTDFQYEKLRWQPEGCEMEAFSGSKFLQRMQNKTLAFLGDSLGREQFQSLMCMVTGGEELPDVLNVGHEYGLVKAPGAKRPDGWAYRFPSTNTTILYYWSASLCDLEPLNTSNPVTDIAMHLDRPPAFLRRFIHKFDVLVLNTGHHWNKGKLNSNRWVIHVGGVPDTEAKFGIIEDAKNFTVHSIIKWVNSQLPSLSGHKAFLRTLAPRHFFNGDWNTGGSCNNTTPLSHGSEVLQNDSSDPLAAEAVRGTNITLLDITALSKLRDEGHISRYGVRGITETQDCLHWCLPAKFSSSSQILMGKGRPKAPQDTAIDLNPTFNEGISVFLPHGMVLPSPLICLSAAGNAYVADPSSPFPLNTSSR